MLSRTGYGGDSWTRDQILAGSPFIYVRQQLFPELIDDSEFEQALEPYTNSFYATWGKSIPELRVQFCGQNQGYCTDRRAGLNHINWQLAEIKLLRAALSRRQLEAEPFQRGRRQRDGAPDDAKLRTGRHSAARTGPL